MNNVIIEELDPIKLPLVKRFYKEHYPSGRANRSELIFTLSIDNTLQGIVRFKTIERFRLLTGMVINTSNRGTGLGHALMEFCRVNTLTSADYCFSFRHLESFYAAHGFKAIETENLPSELKNLYERYCKSGKDLIPMHFHLNC